jgi:ADP-ribose pyrophosphatase YjhB (NUDIX family)
MNYFNIRVYGLLIDKDNRVLISDERRNNFSFTKFPGGGLEFGEGIKEALIREFLEELSVEIEVGELFYFNEHFQASAFNSKHQLFSFYYIVTAPQLHNLGIDEYKFPLTQDGEKQRWVEINTDLVELMTFPIDKIAVSKLMEHKSQFI